MSFGELAALITSLGSLIGAVGTMYNARRVNAVKKEVSPNHGSSLKDAVNRIEQRQNGLISKTEGLTAQVNSLGHQIGEIRAADNVVHADLTARLRALESK